ncbi:hypothetical protein MTO98_23895 [Mucilaginibacter sp. SMC90]|uniref:hypothetical protein n=1 Tax=Mucilaginibacter sp. SMC90 TaxID=2929803 RepID=UPI001FB2DB80|nr:hypothetical protein [Mucilaginibacter sp. SMC90]UOE47454.1 hypothetical protein MTO98_23895 [Mucilaginibacter sp. SMC90]
MKKIMLKLMCVFTALSLAWGQNTVAQEIGANFNHDPEIIDINYLKKTPVEWIRTTPYIFEYINGRKDPATEIGLAKVIEAKKAGYKVAFGFRWDFKKYNLNIPAPGSEEEKKYFATVTAILTRVGGYIDILKLGNEPNLETKNDDLNLNKEGYVPLVKFTERLLTEVALPFYNAHPQYRKPDIYVGSLPALFESKQQNTPGVTGLIKLAQENNDIAGLAVHLHIADTLQIAGALDFVRSIMPLKPIIVPEFSMFRLYNQHVAEPIGDNPAGRAFLQKYHYADTLHLYQWYSIANTKKVSSTEWAELFGTRKWFTPHVMETYYRYFQKYGVVLATYGYLSQSAPANVGPNTAVWFVNPIFACKSLIPDANGDCAANPLWYTDFINIVNKGKRTHLATH